MSKNKLKLIVGKSGAGKNYICDKNRWKSIPSYTTRPKRKHEKEGREHRFVTVEKYYDKYYKEKLPAYTYFAGNHYWTTIKQFESKDYDAYIIDPKGVLWCLKLIRNGELIRDVEIIYIDCVWYKRFYHMMKRGDGIKKAIERLINDMKEFDSFIPKISKLSFDALTIRTIKN